MAAGGGPRRRAQHMLGVAQIAISFLILIAEGRFIRTLNKLHSVQLGYARQSILLFSLNATQAGHRDLAGVVLDVADVVEV